MRSRWRGRTVVAALAAVLVGLPAGLSAGWGTTPSGAGRAVTRAPAVPPPARSHHHHSPERPKYVPPVRHVFVVNIENEDYDDTWGPTSAAPYLSKVLRHKGVLLNTYYGIAHNSLPNYIAEISGQAPSPETQGDCPIFQDFAQTGTASPGQAVGSGCVYPAGVPTLASQLDAAHLRWRGYMDDMGSPCVHPAVNSPDPTQKATAQNEYAARHDPFVYFHGVIDRPAYCAKHVVDLDRLRHDLRRHAHTPNLAYITPDLCDDGHDAPCADGRPGGLVSVDAWMHQWIPRILRSHAFRTSGLLIITADESDGPQSDATACCGEGAAPNTPLPGIVGPGGGVIGALAISPWIKKGTWSTTPYNHYSLLASIEEIFGLAKLGYAATADPFGLDVYNKYRTGHHHPHPHHHHPH